MPPTTPLLPQATPAAGLPYTKLSQPADLAAAKQFGASQPAAKSLGLVYVVENDHISAVITELIVKKNLFGGEVQCYINGQVAFDKISLALRQGASLPDLIILDLDMPLMDGWEFLDALAGLVLPQLIRVFVLTSSIHPDDQPKTLLYKGVRGFFTKPLKGASVACMLSSLQEA